MGEFRMPLLGADMEAGTLVEWKKRPGDPVHRGDIIAVVDTQKGAIEVEAFEDGVLGQTLVEPGAQVPVGTVLAMIDGVGTAPTPAAVPAPTAGVAGPGLGALPAPDPVGRRRTSPAAREAARRLGVDLEHVAGTGPGGAVGRADVERAAAARVARPAPASASAAPAPPAVPAPTDRTAAMRAAIAAAMTRAKREIPHFYLSAAIDLTRANAWLAAENERRPVTERLLPVVLLLKAVARALVDVPALNGFWTDGAFRAGPGIHVGCAISLRGGGLVAPALHDVDRTPLPALMTALRDLVARARAGTLRSSELSDPTITVTNLGDTGADAAFGIIFPPQVAIVGFGRPAARPVAVDGRVEVHQQITATLSVDHRALDGHVGGLFLAALERHLQSPEAL